MDTQDILKKVRKIEIKTRGLSQNVFAGQYHSAFKGRGMAFAEVREYQYGDDVRDIDWNVTARFHRPFVKVFEEERELTVMLLVDVSCSLDFGTTRQMKRDMATEIAATLHAAANYPHKTLWCVFQPHTYTRTKAFMKDFAKALSLADKVVLADIYAARETDTLGISSETLQAEIQALGHECYYFPSFDEIENFLLENCINGDLLITMGAGDVVKIGENLLGK